MPPGDPAALALGLVRALTDAGTRARAIAGMERARSELAWERPARMTLELYERVLAEKRARLTSSRSRLDRLAPARA